MDVVVGIASQGKNMEIMEELHSKHSLNGTGTTWNEIFPGAAGPPRWM